VRIVRSSESAGRAVIRSLVDRGKSNAVDPRQERAVRAIIAAVRQKKDQALVHYCAKWDSLQPGQSVRVSQQEMKQALLDLQAEDPNLVKALKFAAANIRRFSNWQRPKNWMREMQPGVRVGQRVTPLDRVGCYVPGGRYPLPSTLLMTVIPAQVVGVPEIVVTSPRPSKVTLAAAALLGVRHFYRMGGAHAVAAMAYGTESVPPADKIVGPGNSFVTLAKRLVAFDCGIDMLAGPTEALILSHNGNATFIAADLVAQAEHDPESSVVFVTKSARLAGAVAKQTQSLAAGNEVAKKVISRNGVVILTKSNQEAVEIANAIASEHTTVAHENVNKITNAGSLFVGDYSAQPLGDYASGPNHVLPTGGSARFRGGLSVNDFVKVMTVQQVSKIGIRKLAPAVITLAQAEGLQAHSNAVKVRTEKSHA
jgi:histidinol dehydrogenase